jgi:hypothetical protein
MPAVAQDPAAGGQLEQSISLSDDEKRDFASQALVEMELAHKQVTKLLEGAERLKEDERAQVVECLSAWNSKIWTLREVSLLAADSMEEAIITSRGSVANTEFRKVAAALSKVRQFLAEAQACTGDADAAPGVTSVDVVSAALSEADETELTDDGNVDVGTDLPNTSPFQ